MSSNQSNNDSTKNAVDNYFRLIENPEKNHFRSDRDRETLQDIKRIWTRERVNRPSLFLKYFSDDPKLVEEARKEVKDMLYEFEHPSSSSTLSSSS